MSRILNIILILNFYISSMTLADIPSSNTGEQSMIQVLRSSINNIPSLESRVVIGAGISGAKEFNTPPQKGSLNVLLTWQWLDEMQNLAPRTIVVVPEHAFTDPRFRSIEDKIKFIKIKGVLHSRNLENIQSENSDLIAPGTQIIAMLAGDAQQENGAWKLYTEELLTKFLDKLPKDKKILILNGPRTGKYLTLGVINTTAHNQETDHITQIALKISASYPWTVVDFKFGTPSLWGPALKFCLDHPNTILIIPGESTSMISESLSLGLKPVIYQHSAMTATSKHYADTLFREEKAIPYSSCPFDNNIEYKQAPIESQIDVIGAALQKIVEYF